VTAADAQPSLAAKIRQQINLFGHQLVGSGIYWQQGRGDQRRFRLELKVPLGDGLTSFEQVSTGHELWVHEDLLDHSALTKIDLDRVRAALSRYPQQRATPAFSTSLPTGGLPKLLENLNASFQFVSAEEKKLDQLSVWRVEGGWRPAALAELLPEQKERLLAAQAVDWSKVPAQIPQRVVLTLGHDDLFPYRIEYLRERPGKKGSAPVMHALVTTELFEVQSPVAIDPQRFVYLAGNRSFIDDTQAYLKRLGIDDEVPQDARRPVPPAGAGIIRP
jgi:hypothetical protein